MKFEFSAGGVVFKREEGELFILLAKHGGHHGWVFPKGHIDTLETKEEAALREVKEETGVTGKIVTSLSPVSYWFVQDEEKIKKTVYYFVMTYISEDTTIRDEEMEEVRWIGENEVAAQLTYKSDKDVWKEAKTLIKEK